MTSGIQVVLLHGFWTVSSSWMFLCEARIATKLSDGGTVDPDQLHFNSLETLL